MRCLVVGGTGFLGGAIADALVASGHSTTILSRGQTVRDTKPGVGVVRADRYGDLSAISGRDFDWVFDTCAFSPDAVERLLNVLGDGIGRYVMISSISAYGTFSAPGLNEETPVPDATADDLAIVAGLAPDKRGSAIAYGASYGPLKRACEITAEQMLGPRATALRAGLLVGAGDYSDRLTWWVRRLDQAHGDRARVPAPAPPERPVQIIDVRDVARFALRCAADNLGGIWNVTGEPQPLAGLLDAISDVSGSSAEVIWVVEEAIATAGIEPWVDIPLMAPSDPEFRYFLQVSTAKALSAGLECRPIRETLSPLLMWDRERRNVALGVGLTPQQEILLIG